MSVAQELTDDVGQDEVPAGDEGPDLPDRHVAVEVRRARLGDARSELGVAEPRHDRGQGGDEEGDDDAGARVALGHLPGQHVDAGPQGAAHAQGDEVHRAQAAAQLGVLQAAHVHHLPAHQGATEG